MNRCSAKRGIFTLQPCGGQATASCASCQAPLCPEHLYTIGDADFCAGCYGTQDASATPDDWARPGWAQRWRDGYHQRVGYTPFIVADWDTGYFDDGDYAVFNNQAVGADIGNDDGGAGFSDS